MPLLLVASFGLLVSFFANLFQFFLIRPHRRDSVRTGISGGEIARGILDTAGFAQVVVDSAKGGEAGRPAELKKLLLPEEVYRGRSLMAAAWASHEITRALEPVSMMPLKKSWFLIKVVSSAAWILLVLGILFSAHGMKVLSAFLFVSAFLGALFLVPREWEAGERAFEALKKQGIFEVDELGKLKSILNGIRLEGLALLFKGPLSLIREKMGKGYGF